jgi:hypothetical protein
MRTDMEVAWKVSGFILPLTLLLLLALTALAMAGLALLRGEERALGWQRQAFRTNWPEAGWEPRAHLGRGYFLEGGADRAPSVPHRLIWCLDADAEALGSWDLRPSEGRPAVQLGPLTPRDLLAHLPESPEEDAAHRIPLGANLWASSGPTGELRVGSGPESYLVVSTGDLEIGGTGSIRGALLVGGALQLAPTVRLIGGGRVVGPIRSDSAAWTLDPLAVRNALESLPPCPNPLSDLGRVGRQ